MENLLAKLVSMPTITDDTVANELALDYLEEYFKKRGLHTKRYVFKGHGSLIATIKPGIKQVKVLLYGHIDVVPGSEQVFTLRRDGDKLYGRGVLDMKFAIAAYQHVVDRLLGNMDRYDFGIMITSDEEYGGRDGINSIPDLLEEGYRAEVCVMPDGGRAWDVESIAKGFWRFDLVATGRTAHGSRPWEGESASFKLIQALRELHSLFPDPGPETDTLNIGQIHGDGTYNQVPSHMSAQVEFRLASDSSYDRIKAVVDGICSKYGLTTTSRAYNPPLRQDIDNPLLQAFMASITKVTGHQSKPCLSQAASDAPYFNKHGIPCAITYLPGGGHHSEHEWVSTEALEQMPLVVLDYLDTVAKK
jgi:succinyl-diaminopimelate desuccinylase